MQAYLRRHSSFIVISAIVALCLILTTSFVYSAMKKDITISDNGSVKEISTFKNTVGDVLDENKIILSACDDINVSKDEKLKDGTEVLITRANRVIVHMDGIDKYIYTTTKDIRAMLSKAGIVLSDIDEVVPDFDTPISNNMAVNVIRVNEELVEETVDVDYTNQVIKNQSLDVGTTRLVQKGQKGQKQLTIKVRYEDGIEVARNVIDEKTIKQAVNNVVEEGVKTTFTTSRGQTYSFVKSLTMTATAYDATFESCGKHEDDPYYGITASGLRVRPGIVAVDPKVIPLGTWLYVEGYGEALAADVGGAIKGNRIDLYYESPKDVSKFGKKKLKVYILDKPRYKFK